MIRLITTKIAVLTLISLLLFNSLQISSNPPHTPQPIETTTEPSQKTKPTQYEIVRKELVRSVNNYINTNYPKSKLTGDAIVQACEKHGFDICFALAQAEIESHFGTKGVAARTNSPWNVGAHDGRTAEQMKTRGLGYKHPNHSIEPYIKLVKTKYLGENKSPSDLMVRYVSLGGYRYASNPNYEKSLANKYKFICQTTKINDLQNTLRSVF